MARKKRHVTAPQFRKPVKAEEKKKERFRDQFQTAVGEKVETIGKKVEGKGKNILYAIAAVAVLAVLIGIFYAWNKRSNSQAQAALGKAIETATAQISDTPPAPGSTAKTFKTEKERSEAAVAEFQTVADKFGGDVGEKAKYFVAVNKLRLPEQRPNGVQELEALASNSGEVGKLSKFALAHAKADDGKFDEAAALYLELAAMDDPVLAKDTINFELASVYEKQGKKAEAADVYFKIAKAASEAKDPDGENVPLSATARKAKEKLEELNPEKAKEITEPAPKMPTGMPQMPF
jgi:tetratricopeptide (TPR) repeat protein